MDKTADRINRQTLDFSNRIYEELSTIVCQREDLRYFNYDHNDEKIDSKLERMFELLDDIYNSCIEKKTGWITRKPPLKPKKILFPEEDLPQLDIHTPSPRKPKSQPKDSSGGRAGNPEVNKAVRKKAEQIGLTPQKLGREEYELKMVQAAHEALTDSNFHSEARKLIAIIEDNPELAKNPADDPNKPGLGEPGYEDWVKGTAWGSKYGDTSPETDELGQAAAQEAGWAGRDALDGIAFELKMRGFKDLALKIQSVFDDEKNESSMRLNSMLPEGKHKKLERDLKNLAGVAKIDFSEALESLEEDGVLEAMDHLENLMDRIKDVHKQLKRKS